MLPRSSIATSRFTSTRLRASARDPLERPTVTMAGMSSGVMPTAIASEKSSASSSGLWNAMLKMKIVTVSTPATRTRRRREPAQPLLECGRGRTFREPGCDATERGCEAGCDHHTASRPLVNDRPHEGARGEVDARAARLRLRGLRHRHRLAGEHGLVALQRVHVEQSHVGGDDVAHLEVDDIAGYERGRVDELIVTVAADECTVVNLGVQGFDRALRPVLVEEAQQHADGDDRGDDDRVGGIAGEPGYGRTAEQQQQQRVSELPEQHPERRDTVLSQHVAALALE